MAHARTILNTAPLATEFGREYATWLFGEEIFASLPVYTRGPNKGLPKGHVIWLRTTTRGYHPCAGPVREDTTVRAWLGESPYTPEGSASRAQWLGRVQAVCASRDYLGPENRARRLAEIAAEAARQRREYAEMTVAREATR